MNPIYVKPTNNEIIDHNFKKIILTGGLILYEFSKKFFKSLWSLGLY